MSLADPSTPAADRAATGADTSDRPLDEIMLAMDVVDTLRHRQHLVERELGEAERDAQLIERLREIYTAQGIEVTDTILREGVAALKENRFVYTPPSPSFQISLARLYIQRGRIAKIGLAVIAVLAALWIGYQALVVWPAERAAEQAQVELSQTLPSRIDAALTQIGAVARASGPVDTANQLAAEGRAAIAAGDASAARDAADRLDALLTDLNWEYDLRIVSRAGEMSGVWRIPEANPQAQNFYLIVEAIAPDGSTLSLPVTSEETGRTETVDRWGVRVDEDVFNRVRDDKQDDGILQNDVVAVKERGLLQPTYELPVAGGSITEW